MNTCYIIGAGDCPNLDIQPAAGDFLIAADGGLRYLEAAGLQPDLILGDFDSLGYMPQGNNLIRLPVEKDVTDTEAAAQEALRRGYRRIRIYGACGGARRDHTLANLQVLAALAEQGADAAIIDGSLRIHALTGGGRLTLPARASGYVSLIAHSARCTGLSIRGLKYEAADLTLTNTQTLGVSNEFIGKAAEISVGTGTLFVFDSNHRG